MTKRELQEINAGSTADIAFLLLIFFLVATTMDVDTGLTRLLPPPTLIDVPPVRIKDRNLLTVWINKNDELMVRGKPGTRVDQLKDITMEFFTNPTNSEDLPEKKTVQVHFPPGSSSIIPTNGIWTGEVSNGVISLQNDRSTTYKKYLEVQNELVAAVNQLRQDFCKLYFDRDFDDLSMANESEKQIAEGIREIFKMNISEAEPKKIN